MTTRLVVLLYGQNIAMKLCSNFFKTAIIAKYVAQMD